LQGVVRRGASEISAAERNRFRSYGLFQK
jgi:hypothetical protein